MSIPKHHHGVSAATELVKMCNAYERALAFTVIVLKRHYEDLGLAEVLAGSDIMAEHTTPAEMTLTAELLSRAEGLVLGCTETLRARNN